MHSLDVTDIYLSASIISFVNWAVILCVERDERPQQVLSSLEEFLCFSLQLIRFDAAVFMSHLVTQMAISLQRWCCVPYREVQSLKMFIAVGHRLWRQRSAVTVRSDFWLRWDNATKPVAAAQLSLFVVLQKWSESQIIMKQFVVWVCVHQRRTSRMEPVNTATSTLFSLCCTDPRGPLTPSRVNKPKLCLLTFFQYASIFMRMKR